MGRERVRKYGKQESKKAEFIISQEGKIKTKEAVRDREQSRRSRSRTDARKGGQKCTQGGDWKRRRKNSKWKKKE